MPNVTKTLAPVADYLVRVGWIQGHSIHFDTSDPPCCAAEAMQRVLPAAEYEPAIVALLKHVRAWRLGVSLVLLDPARAEINVITWNDTAGRTFTEVERALRSTSYEVPA